MRLLHCLCSEEGSIPFKGAKEAIRLDEEPSWKLGSALIAYCRCESCRFRQFCAKVDLMRKFDCCECDKKVHLDMLDPSEYGPNRFRCPSCGAVYVRVEARSEEELKKN